MSNKVTVELSAKDAEMVAAWQRGRQNIDAFNQKLDQTNQKSIRNTKSSKNFFGGVGRGVKDALLSFSGIGSIMGGIAATAALINAEHEALLERQKRSEALRISVGEAVRRTRIAFTEDDTLKDRDLETVITEVANDTRSSEQVVAAALTTAFSAKGSLSNATAVEAVRQSLKLLPNDLETASTLSGRALDVAKFSGQTDIKAIIGFLQNIQQSSRVTSLDKVGSALVPAVGAVTKTGDTPEQAAELLAAMTQLLGDEEGRKSATAVRNLSSNLANFVPKKRGRDDRGSFRVPQNQIDQFEASKSTTKRIESLQTSPELKRQFIGQTSFDSASREFIKSLLDSDILTLAEVAKARQNIKPLDFRQAKLFDKKIEQLEGGRFQQDVTNLQESERVRANTQLGTGLTRTEAGLESRSANTLRLFQEVLEDVDFEGPDSLTEFLPKKALSRATVDRPERIEAIAARLLTILKSGKEPRGGFSKNEVNTLNNAIEKLQKRDEFFQKQKKEDEQRQKLKVEVTVNGRKARARPGRKPNSKAFSEGN